MKYKVNYKSGNGYGCSCCASFENNYEEFSTYQEALDFAAHCSIQDWRVCSYKGIEAYATSPDEFVLVDGEYEVNFDVVKFNTDLSERAKTKEQEQEEAKKREKAEEEAKNKKETEERELKQLEALKKKYEH